MDEISLHALDLVETNDQLFTAVAKHKAATDPVLAYEIISVVNQVGAGAPPPYVTPVFLATLDTAEGRRATGHLVTGASTHPYAGPLFAAAQVELNYFIEVDNEKRKQAGLDIINNNHETLFSTIDRLPVLRRALEEVSENKYITDAERARYKSSLEKLKGLDQKLPSPALSRDVMGAYAEVLARMNTVLPKELSKQLFDSLNSTTNTSEALKDIRKRLRNTEKSVDLLTGTSDELTQMMLEVSQAQNKATQEAKSKELIAEVNAYGQLVGMIISIKDPQAGKAVDTLVTSMTKIYEAKQALSAGFSMVAFSGGLGAAFAIAGALSELGGKKSGGEDSTTIILKAVREIAQRIEELSRQVHKLDEKLSRFIEATSINFSVMAYRLESIEAKIDYLALMTRDTAKQALDLSLSEAVRNFQTETDPKKKRIALSKLSALCLEIGADFACRDLYTGLTETAKLDFGQLMKGLKRDLEEAAKGTDKEVLLDQFLSDGLLKFLERNPFATWLAITRLREAIGDDTGDVLGVAKTRELKQAVMGETSWPPRGISEKASAMIRAGHSNLAGC